MTTLCIGCQNSSKIPTCKIGVCGTQPRSDEQQIPHASLVWDDGDRWVPQHVWRREAVLLVDAEGGDGVDVGGAAGGEVAGEDGDGG
jgi:hypothetical protein